MPFFFAQRLDERRSQHQSAILNRMMRIHFEVPLTMQFQVHDSVFGEEGEHVIKERNARFHRCLPDAVEVQRQQYSCLTRRPPKGRLTFVHSTIKCPTSAKTKRKLSLTPPA